MSPKKKRPPTAIGDQLRLWAAGYGGTENRQRAEGLLQAAAYVDAELAGLRMTARALPPHVEAVARAIEGARDAIVEALLVGPRAAAARVEAAHANAPAREDVSPASAPAPKSAIDGLSAVERAILTVLRLRHPRPSSARLVAVRSRYRMSGTFHEAVRSLRAAGYIAGKNEALAVTDEGRARGLLNVALEAPGGELAQAWIVDLAAQPGRTLATLVDVYPRDMSTAEMLDATGYRPSGTFQAGIRELVRAGVVVKRRRRYAASPELMVKDEPQP